MCEQLYHMKGEYTPRTAFIRSTLNEETLPLMKSLPSWNEAICLFFRSLINEDRDMRTHQKVAYHSVNSILIKLRGLFGVFGLITAWPNQNIVMLVTTGQNLIPFWNVTKNVFRNAISPNPEEGISY